MTSITNIIFHAPFKAEKKGKTLIFPIAEPWYRSLPVSCIADLTIKINGKEIDRDKITTEIDGVKRTIDECAAAHDAFWFIQDRMFVHIADCDVSDQAEISAHLLTRIPYIMVGPTTALPHHTIQTETFEVTAA